MTDTPASLDALGIEPVAWHYLSADEDEAHLMFGRVNVNALVPYGTETPLYSATDLAPLIAKARRVEAALRQAINFLNSAPLESGTCCCGDPIEGHGYHSGHSPVDELSYHANKLAEEFCEALKENTDD